MNKIEEIECAVKELSAEELSAFQAWFSKFDAEAWDRQLDADGRRENSTLWPSVPR